MEGNNIDYDTVTAKLLGHLDAENPEAAKQLLESTFRSSRLHQHLTRTNPGDQLVNALNLAMPDGIQGDKKEAPNAGTSGGKVLDKDLSKRKDIPEKPFTSPRVVSPMRRTSISHESLLQLVKVESVQSGVVVDSHDAAKTTDKKSSMAHELKESRDANPAKADEKALKAKTSGKDNGDVRVEKDSKKSKDKDKKKKTDKRKVVFVAYKINCISNIDSISCTYEVDAKIFYFWDDEKVIGRPKGTSLNLKEEPDLFDPDIQITNSRNLEKTLIDTRVTDSKKGSVKMSIHVKGECFLTAMELHLFPFDCQNLLITLKPYKLEYEKVILVSKPEEECAMDNNVTQEWDVFGHSTISDITDPLKSSTKKPYSSLSIAVLVTRRPGWFINNVFVITFLLLLVSWSTFAMYEFSQSSFAINTINLGLRRIAAIRWRFLLPLYSLS